MHNTKQNILSRLKLDKKVIEDINRIHKELKSLWFHQKARKRELYAELALLKQIVKQAVDKANNE